MRWKPLCSHTRCGCGCRCMCNCNSLCIHKKRHRFWRGVQWLHQLCTANTNYHINEICQRNANENMETWKEIQGETHVLELVFLAIFLTGSSSSSMIMDCVGFCNLGRWVDNVQSGARMTLKIHESVSYATRWWPLFKHA